MRNANRLLTIIAALSISGLASAADKDKLDYESLDTDKDGKISKAEAKASSELNKQWKDLDVDRDNMINEGEFARFESKLDTDTKTDTKTKSEQKLDPSVDPMDKTDGGVSGGIQNRTNSGGVLDIK